LGVSTGVDHLEAITVAREEALGAPGAPGVAANVELYLPVPALLVARGTTHTISATTAAITTIAAMASSAFAFSRLRGCIVLAPCIVLTPSLDCSSYFHLSSSFSHVL